VDILAAYIVPLAEHPRHLAWAPLLEVQDYSGVTGITDFTRKVNVKNNVPWQRLLVSSQLSIAIFHQYL
jgi:hypothetical protein